MEELHRFLLLRPSEAVDSDNAGDSIVNLNTGDDIQKEIRAKKDQNLRTVAAHKFMKSGAVNTEIDDFYLGKALAKVGDYFRAYPIDRREETHCVLEDIVAILSSSKGATDSSSGPESTSDSVWLKKLTVDNKAWKNLEAQLKNGILILRENGKGSRMLPRLGAALRGVKLIEKALSGPATMRPGIIANSTFYLSDIRVVNEPQDLPEEEADENVDGQDKSARLARAMDELLYTPLVDLDFDEKEEAITDSDQDASETHSFANNSRLTRKARVSPRTSNRFSAATKSTLEELNIDVEKESLDNIVSLIRAEQRHVFSSDTQNNTRKIIKGTTLSGTKSKPKFGLFPAPKFEEIVPSTTGQISPAGIGDLLIIKQQLKRYEGGDIAHVENVLQGELKKRDHRRRQYTEDIFVDEEEFESSEMQESQTTGRFELKSEIDKQVKTKMSVDAGVKVTASYGPTVKVEADTKFAYTNAKDESRKRANTLSKEIVEKAVTEYRENIKHSHTRKISEEIEESNIHSLDATQADQHVVGIYQWLNKVYEAQLFNYGLRVMYEFMVPEPAAYYIWSLGRQADDDAGIAVPPTFNLSAKHINEWNYQDLAAKFEATGISAPPEPFITVDYSKIGGPNPEKGPMLDAGSVTIPDGYEYVTYAARVGYSSKDDDPTKGITILISHDFKHPGTVPINIRGYSLTGWHAYVHVLCRRTAISYNNWQQKVWDALYQGHQTQVAAYEEKLAALMAQEGIEIKGQNPILNRQTEKVELKKSCITMITGTYPAWARAIKETPGGPVVNLGFNKWQGPYIRFMEQAFEWENMTYVFYPYFWARHSKWQELMGIQDVDTVFQEFLKAGYARVVVPVRPGFEETVEHFRQTGQVWSGGKLPQITDEDYLPIAEELKERQKAPGDEIAVGDPWEVTIPTQLVRLRPGNSLPEWEKQENGFWKEKN